MLRHVAFFLRSFCKKQYSTPSCYVPHQLYNRNSRNTRADHTVFLLWYCDFQATVSCQHIDFYLSSYFMTELLWHRIYIYFSMSVSTIQWSCHNRPWYIPSNNGWDAREYFIPVLFFSINSRKTTILICFLIACWQWSLVTKWNWSRYQVSLIISRAACVAPVR